MVQPAFVGRYAPLLADDVIAVAELGSGAKGPVAVTPPHVQCGRPLVYPISPTDLPAFLRARATAGARQYFGVLFAFDLEETPAQVRCASIRFEVVLDDPEAIAIDIHPDGDALGVSYGQQPDDALVASAMGKRAVEVSGSRRAWLQRLRPLAASPRPVVSGVQTGRLRWAYQDPNGRTPIPRQLAMHALLEVPVGLNVLRGEIGVQAVVHTGRRENAVLVETMRPVAFAEALGSLRAPSETDLQARLDPSPSVRLCLAADVVGYSGQGNALAGQTQQRLVDLLSAARRNAGLNQSATQLQPQGDEEFAILPIGIDESIVIARLVEGIQHGLQAVNAGGDAMRLRVAFHRGLMAPAANGWVGAAPIAVHRILNCDLLREALQDNQWADFVLGIPDVLYRDVVARSRYGPDPAAFRPIVIDMPDKGFVEHAWMYLPPRPGPA